MIYGRSNLGGAPVVGKANSSGFQAGCYITLSNDQEWDNAVHALTLAVECLNFAEDCNGISQYDKNVCKRYANLIYDLIDRIEGAYRPPSDSLSPRIKRLLNLK